MDLMVALWEHCGLDNFGAGGDGDGRVNGTGEIALGNCNGGDDNSDDSTYLIGDDEDEDEEDEEDDDENKEDDDADDKDDHGLHGHKIFLFLFLFYLA